MAETRAAKCLRFLENSEELCLQTDVLAASIAKTQTEVSAELAWLHLTFNLLDLVIEHVHAAVLRC